MLNITRRSLRRIIANIYYYSESSNIFRNIFLPALLSIRHNTISTSDLHAMLLQQLQRYSGTCLGIGKSVMVFCQVVSAISRHSVQLMVGQHALELPARRAACAIELILRIVHDIFLKHRPQTALVKLTVVSHQRQPLDKRLYLAPHIGKFRCVSHILQCQPMHPCVPIREEVGMRINKAVELVGNLSVSHHNHSHAAHTAVALVGCLKIYRCKILHSLCL